MWEGKQNDSWTRNELIQVHPGFAPRCVFGGTSEFLGTVALWSNDSVDDTK